MKEELQAKIYDLLPLISVTTNGRKVKFVFEHIEYNSDYYYITKAKNYKLVKKLMKRIIQLMNEDIKTLERDYEEDVFPQLVKEFNL